MVFHSERLTGHQLFAHFYNALNIPTSQREHETCIFLGITAQTLRRYLSGKSEPPAPLVSLLWHESHFGRAALDEHAHRGMLYARGEADGLKAEAVRLRARISHLESEISEIKSAMNEQRPRFVAMNESFFQRA